MIMIVVLATDLYNLLSVASNATEDEIKKAYRKKAKEHHPDKNINDPEAGKKFQEIAAAYEILSDQDSRAIYDEKGIEGLSGVDGHGGTDANEFFAQFFANGMFGFDFEGGGGTSGRPGKENDAPVECDVTLEDLYNGKVFKINISKDIECGQCKGTGSRNHAKPKTCSTCQGKGWVSIQTQISSNRIGTSRAQCHDCHGVGERLKEKDRCKKCKGAKIVSEKTRQEIFVEKGMEHRQRIVLAGAGDEKPGMPPDDVILVLNAAPHESFERSGNDLLTHVKITLSEALLGFSRILVKHLDGRGVKVTSPPGKIIQTDESIVLRGEGMPIYKRSHEKGDLYVIMSIEMPDQEWLKTVNIQALSSLLPPKKTDVTPLPQVVDEAEFEESDIVDFGDNDEDWENEDDDEDVDYGVSSEPECRQQ